ncbi:MAG: hypothetical protein AB1696_00660 [Planctomycetota bacterium]
MAKRKKIVFLGAGSAIFTERLMADLIRQKDMPHVDVVMHDINPRVLRYMTAYTRMMAEREGADITVTGERSRARAFDGADFIIITLTVGGGKQDLVTVETPLKYGFYQPVGDTLGPGGLMRIYSSYSTFKGFVTDMQKYCPQVLVINFTNPMTMVCRLMNRLSEHKVKVVGLCHGTWGITRQIAAKLNLDPREIKVVPAGVNHFIWFLKITHKGKDLYPQIRKDLLEKTDGKLWPVTMELLRIYGYYPSPGCSHLAEFVPFYLKSKETMEKYGLRQRDNRETNRRKNEARKFCEDVVSGKKELPPLKDSGEMAMQIIRSTVNDLGKTYYANIPNKGYISNLPDEIVVEVPVRFRRNSFEGVKVGPLPQGIKSLITPIIETQELGVDASIRGDRALALQALLSDPNVNDVEKAEKMLDDMLRKSKSYVPQFAR